MRSKLENDSKLDLSGKDLCTRRLYIFFSTRRKYSSRRHPIRTHNCCYRHHIRRLPEVKNSQILIPWHTRLHAGTQGMIWPCRCQAVTGDSALQTLSLGLAHGTLHFWPLLEEKTRGLDMVTISIRVQCTSCTSALRNHIMRLWLLGGLITREYAKPRWGKSKSTNHTHSHTRTSKVFVPAIAVQFAVRVLRVLSTDGACIRKVCAVRRTRCTYSEVQVTTRHGNLPSHSPKCTWGHSNRLRPSHIHSCCFP